MIEEIIRITNAKRAGDGYLGLCVAHEDSKPSLSFKESAGKILLKCHTGCSFDQIREALKARGLELGSSRDPGWETVWRVYGRDRQIVAQHVRIDTAEGKKVFWQGPNGEKAKLSEIGVRLVDLPPYAWERVQPGERVFVCEGEKAADALLRRGITAVGTFGAEVNPKAEALQFLREHDVVLWPDNDEPGRKHMAIIGTTLKSMGVLAKVLIWPDAPAKGDAADFVAAGHGLEDLEKLLSATPATKLVMFRERIRSAMDELDRLHVGDFSDYVPTGLTTLDRKLGGGMSRRKLTLIGAPTGAGKTTLVMQFAMAAESRGLVIVVSPEMSADELVAREITRRSNWSKWARAPWQPESLRTAAVEAHTLAASELLREPPNVAIYDSLDVSLLDVEEEVRSLSKREKVALIALDYAQQLAEDDGRTARYLAVGQVALKAIEMAREFDAAVLVTSQVNPIRGEKGLTVGYNIRESANLEQKASTVLLFLVNRDDDGKIKSAQFQCTKARDGALFRLDVDFDSSCLSVRDKRQDEIPEVRTWVK